MQTLARVGVVNRKNARLEHILMKIHAHVKRYVYFDFYSDTLWVMEFVRVAVSRECYSSKKSTTNSTKKTDVFFVRYAVNFLLPNSSELIAANEWLTFWSNLTVFSFSMLCYFYHYFEQHSLILRKMLHFSFGHNLSFWFYKHYFYFIFFFRFLFFMFFPIV